MDKKIYIAGVSGGPDSMYLLWKYQKKIRCVCHVNYNLRKSADRDEKIVRNFCKLRKIMCKIIHVNDKMYKKYKEKYGNNFEYVARKIRYDFYNKICVKLGIKTVLLAHHLDDFLETCIMQEQQNKFRLYYGMHSKSKYEDINILRPFLKAKMRKKQIQDLCIKEKIPFGIDETNFDTKYTRNKIRKQITDLDEKEYEKILDKFLLFNQKHNLKYLKTINLFNKWKESNFCLNFYKVNIKKTSLEKSIIFEFLKNFNESKISSLKIKSIIDFLRLIKKGNKFRLAKNNYLIIDENKSLIFR